MAQLDFRLTEGAQSLVVIPVMVDGAGPFDFILDTGASTGLLAPPLARKLGIGGDDKREARGAGGAVQAAIGRVGSIAIGDARAEGLEVGITDLESIGKAVAVNIDGVIGCDFLQKFVVIVDYPARRLQLARPGETEVAGTGAGHGVPFTVPNPERPLGFVPVWVNGRGPFEFIIETGASMTTLSGELAERLGIRRGRLGVAIGGGGQVAVAPAQVDSLAVGGVQTANLGVIVGDFLKPIEQAIGADIDGLLGYNFLRRYRMTIDYPARTFFLK